MAKNSRPTVLPDEDDVEVADDDRVPYLSVIHCPAHGVYGISLDRLDSSGGGSGLRLTGGKCCGSWKTLKQWKIDPMRLLKDVQSMVPTLVEQRTKRA